MSQMTFTGPLTSCAFLQAMSFYKLCILQAVHFYKLHLLQDSNFTCLSFYKLCIMEDRKPSPDPELEKTQKNLKQGVIEERKPAPDPDRRPSKLPDDLEVTKRTYQHGPPKHCRDLEKTQKKYRYELFVCHPEHGTVMEYGNCYWYKQGECSPLVTKWKCCEPGCPSFVHLEDGSLEFDLPWAEHEHDEPICCLC